jgi:hypothetical protein
VPLANGLGRAPYWRLGYGSAPQPRRRYRRPRLSRTGHCHRRAHRLLQLMVCHSWEGRRVLWPLRGRMGGFRPRPFRPRWPWRTATCPSESATSLPEGRRSYYRRPVVTTLPMPKPPLSSSRYVGHREQGAARPATSPSAAPIQAGGGGAPIQGSW